MRIHSWREYSMLKRRQEHSRNKNIRESRIHFSVWRWCSFMWNMQIQNGYCNDKLRIRRIRSTSIKAVYIRMYKDVLNKITNEQLSIVKSNTTDKYSANFCVQLYLRREKNNSMYFKYMTTMRFLSYDIICYHMSRSTIFQNTGTLFHQNKIIIRSDYF